MSPPAIRLATPDDAPRLHALLHAAYAEAAAEGAHFTVTRAGVETVRERITRHTTFVAEQTTADGTPELLATVSVRFPWVPGEKHHASYPFIHWFATHPGHKRRGLGAQLLDHAEHHFLRDQIKAPAVYLATATRHPWLVGLYAGRGYQPFGHTVNPLGTALVWMRKILVPALYEALPAPRESVTAAEAPPQP
ncbi:MAG: GNAT family N-acetyltransferase [Comamonas sp.]